MTRPRDILLNDLVMLTTSLSNTELERVLYYMIYQNKKTLSEFRNTSTDYEAFIGYRIHSVYDREKIYENFVRLMLNDFKCEFITRLDSVSGELFQIRSKSALDIQELGKEIQGYAIYDVFLLTRDGQQHAFKNWISNPDQLKNTEPPR